MSTNQNESEFYYRLPVNLEFVAKSYRDESPDTFFFIDLLTGGVFSLGRPDDDDWERTGEGFDHEISCGFQHTSYRFLCVDEFTAQEKKQIIKEFAASLGDPALGGRLLKAALGEKPFAAVEGALGGRPAELYYWREHLEKACSAAAADFLELNGITTEPLKPVDQEPVLEAALFVN